MTRTEAIEILAQRDLAELGHDQRESLLLDWWSIDADDPDYHALPSSVRMALSQSDAPTQPEDPVYDPLLMLALRRAFVGTMNSYLESRLATIGAPASVEGAVESLEICPCCRFRSIHERANYEVCRVCFWEDDGTTEPDVRSGPNHMTLREARDNFAKFGAVDEAARRHVFADGQHRYTRAGQ